ncbi:MAG TPA: YiiD C-terminal domain-containing protein [Desulfomonilaceae bacterium]|nr:YiiD C-terminal domain-containing protein [Desulfomonilaceae bacterium]
MAMSVEAVKELIENKVAFVRRMKLKAVELKPCHVKLSAPLQDNENHIGTMYAGALFTLAEIPGGALFLTTFDSSRYYPIVKEMTMTFLRPARTDVTIENDISEEEYRRIQHELTSNGKAEFVLLGRVMDEKGEVVASSRGTYQIRAIGI